MRRIYELNLRLRLPPRGAAPLEHPCGISDEELRVLAAAGFDTLWPLGLWTVGDSAHQLAIRHGEEHRPYDDARTSWSHDDVDGSPFALSAYEVDPRFGGAAALVELRRRAAAHGLQLLVDFVPNHTGLDHPWTREHPDRYVMLAPGEGGEDEGFPRPDGEPGRLAHGRDPFFPPWTDTAQLDLGRSETREALTGELLRVAEHADGVRCDMAMLLLERIRSKTWKERAASEKPALRGEFWHGAIDAVRAAHPEFTFLAEAYWGTEEELWDLGFDLVYDKELYDHLLHGDLEALEKARREPPAKQRRRLRFLENHDEIRAKKAFPTERYAAAAVVTASLPGALLFHEGQLEGFGVHVPVQLRRADPQSLDEEALRFHARLLTALKQPELSEGAFRCELAELESGDGPYAVHCWQLPDERRSLAVANLSDEPLALRVIDIAPRPGAEAIDVFTDERFALSQRADGSRYHAIDLEPWQARWLFDRPLEPCEVPRCGW